MKFRLSADEATKALTTAILNSNPQITPEEIDAYLECGADINQPMENGDTLLIYAIQYARHKTVIKKLIDAGADINAQDRMGYTALHMAFSQNSYSGNQWVANYLLDRNPDVSKVTKGGFTVLHLAACNDDAKLVSRLLARNVDPNIATTDGTTALHQAVQQSTSAVVQALLEGGANPNLTLDSGKTPLHYAAKGGHKAIVALLLEHDANPDTRMKDGSTALHLAAQEGHMETLQLLIDEGADYYTQNQFGLDAYEKAEVNGRQDIVRYLLDIGSPINFQLPSRPGTAHDRINQALEGWKSWCDEGAAITQLQHRHVIYALNLGKEAELFTPSRWVGHRDKLCELLSDLTKLSRHRIMMQQPNLSQIITPPSTVIDSWSASLTIRAKSLESVAL